MRCSSDHDRTAKGQWYKGVLRMPFVSSPACRTLLMIEPTENTYRDEREITSHIYFPRNGKMINTRHAVFDEPAFPLKYVTDGAIGGNTKHNDVSYTYPRDPKKVRMTT